MTEQHIRVSLEYPRSNRVKAIRVDLEDVRAANELVITYDFERDGWCIQSPTIMQWEVGGPYDEGLEEVAFIPAWSEKAEAALVALNS